MKKSEFSLILVHSLVWSLARVCLWGPLTGLIPPQWLFFAFRPYHSWIGGGWLLPAPLLLVTPASSLRSLPMPLSSVIMSNFLPTQAIFPGKRLDSVRIHLRCSLWRELVVEREAWQCNGLQGDLGGSTPTKYIACNDWFELTQETTQTFPHAFVLGTFQVLSISSFGNLVICYQT